MRGDKSPDAPFCPGALLTKQPLIRPRNRALAQCHTRCQGLETQSPPREGQPPRPSLGLAPRSCGAELVSTVAASRWWELQNGGTVGGATSMLSLGSGSGLEVLDWFL